MNLIGLSPNVGAIRHPQGGLALKFSLMDSRLVQMSDSWSVAGWKFCFIELPAHQALQLPAGDHYIKVISGRLDNIDRTCFADDFTIRSTAVTADQVTTGERSCLFTLFTLERELSIEHMDQCEFVGNGSRHLRWQTFHEKYGSFTDAFLGHDCHMASGIHLQDESSEEIVYVNFWTCGKGVDLTTHNHSQPPSDMAPAFAEVHWVFRNGTGLGGMYETSEPGAKNRTKHPMQAGEEHGPYFAHHAGKPVLLDTGAVQYPWHGWQGGDDGSEAQAYDFVAAFEINPKYAEIG